MENKRHKSDRSIGGMSAKKLILQHLSDLTIPVIVYESYEKGVKADEGL